MSNTNNYGPNWLQNLSESYITQNRDVTLSPLQEQLDEQVALTEELYSLVEALCEELGIDVNDLMEEEEVSGEEILKNMPNGVPNATELARRAKEKAKNDAITAAQKKSRKDLSDAQDAHHASFAPGQLAAMRAKEKAEQEVYNAQARKNSPLGKFPETWTPRGVQSSRSRAKAARRL